MDENCDDALVRQAILLRNKQWLGRSPIIGRLFDYLVQTTREGRSPKEIEVAAAVFDRGESFDAMQDASVRVYVHRLRKKLDEHYAGPGANEPMRLAMPKGEYRLSLVPNGHADTATPTAAEITADQPARVPWRRLAVPVALLSLLGASVLTGLLWLALLRPDAPDRALAAVRHSALWAPTVAAEKPIVVVLGDYYLFGEMGSSGQVERLVREFSVNSRYDLDDRVMQHPELNGRYVDLGLRYYPLGVARALRDVVPILRTSGRRVHPVRVIPVSDLTPDMLRISNVVYIGYFSGLGSLRDPLFNTSRLAVGDSYDELVDRRTGRSFTATTGGPNGAGAQLDYGYVGTFPGPTGNSVVIISGTRDAAVMQAAQYATDAGMLDDLAVRTNHASAFEALLRVDTLSDQDLAGKLVLASPMARRPVWGAASPQRFPDEAPTRAR